MTKLTEQELLDELKKRFDEKQKVLFDLGKATEKLEAVNRKLRESEALKSNFLSNIRNEMNDPLASIMGLSKQLISSTSQDREKVISTMEMIHSEAFNLEFQLKNIFAAAEIEAGEAYPDISNVDIKGLVGAIIEMLDFKLNAKGVTIRFVYESAEEGAYFRTDPAKLHLIILNILANAIEYSEEKGTIDFKARLSDKAFAFSIKDYGKGIEKSYVDKIFDRFIQLDTGSTKSHKGQGLGLCITKSYIEHLHGSIAVSSEPGKGSLFEVTLPEAELHDRDETFSEASNEFIFDEKEF